MLGFSRISRFPGNRTKALCMFITGCSLLFALTSQKLHSQEAQNDLTNSSLEELLRTDASPNGMAGGYTLNKGEIKWGYRFMSMKMKGLIDGSSKITSNEGFGATYSYTAVPTEMETNVHMLMPMFAPTENITVLFELPFVSKSMDMVLASGDTFTLESTGVGDVVTTIMYTWAKTDNDSLVLDFGVSLPSGSTSRKDDSPLGISRQLPYAMQLGSGTTDFIPGVTYTKTSGMWSYGSLGNVTMRFGTNSNEYRLGDRIKASTWVARELRDWISVSTRLDGQWWGNVKGSDPALSPSLTNTEDPNRQGGKRVDLYGGVTLNVAEGAFSGNRLRFEGGLPVIQSLDGLQLRAKRFFSITWDWVF
ncbi:MAG: hypothetical protein ACI9S8_001353 [Chlamydiales bacterium]|jgi:hypothetical protein